MEFPNKFVLKPTPSGESEGLYVDHVVEFDGEHYNIKYKGDVYPYTEEIIQEWIECFGWYTVEVA